MELAILIYLPPGFISKNYVIVIILKLTKQITRITFADGDCSVQAKVLLFTYNCYYV